jgi:hypothetical protein
MDTNSIFVSILVGFVVSFLIRLVLYLFGVRDPQLTRITYGILILIFILFPFLKYYF